MIPIKKLASTEIRSREYTGRWTWEPCSKIWQCSELSQGLKWQMYTYKEGRRKEFFPLAMEGILRVYREICLMWEITKQIRATVYTREFLWLHTRENTSKQTHECKIESLSWICEEKRDRKHDLDFSKNSLKHTQWSNHFETVLLCHNNDHLTASLNIT